MHRSSRSSRRRSWTTPLIAAAALLALGITGMANGAERGERFRGHDRDHHGRDHPHVDHHRGHDRHRGHDHHDRDRHHGRHHDDHRHGHGHGGVSFRIGDGNVSFGLHIGAHHRGHHHVHRCVPGHYETRATQVLVAPARCERRWVPPVFVTRYDHCGRPYTVKVRDGYYHTINIPARYETRYTKVWVPGSCDNGCSHRSHPVFDRHPGHGRY